MLLSVALGLTVSLIFYQSQQRIDAALADERGLTEIVTSILHLALLSQDISLHPHEFRARNQWLKQHRALGELLRKIPPGDPEDQGVLDRLRREHENQTQLFETLRLLTQQHEIETTEVTAEKQENQIHRMSFSTQSMLSDALSLERQKRAEITSYRRQQFQIAQALVGAVTLIIAVLAYLIGRSVSQPLLRLRRDIEIVGAGDLGHRVGTTSRDELGDLSRDFDRMLERLQQVTASREDLQREIEVRTHTEEALRENEQRLKQAQSIAHLGNWEWDLESGQIKLSDETYRIFGRQPGLFTPTRETLLETVHSDDHDFVAQCLEKAQQGQGFELEYRICLPDGDIRVVHQIGKPEFDDAGKPVKVFGTVHDHSGRHIRMVGTVHDITERKHAEDELHEANARLGAQLMEIERLHESLREQAIRDPLTGLFNRRYMEETLAREFSGAERERSPLSLIMLDVDRFKKINDTYGHSAGDMVLRALSELLRRHIRGRDFACRFGGEEFLAVLPQTSIEVAAQRAELWRTSFEALRMSHDGKDIRATISLGVAAYAIHGTTIQSVVTAADKGLYSAKESGRNRVVVAPTPG
ncbi:MAG TPA: diguanylate cyclase [Gallionella sp.]|nr:diguanylate cyclase [Gallionella sp.]